MLLKKFYQHKQAGYCSILDTQPTHHCRSGLPISSEESEGSGWSSPKVLVLCHQIPSLNWLTLAEFVLIFVKVDSALLPKVSNPWVLAFLQ